MNCPLPFLVAQYTAFTLTAYDGGRVRFAALLEALVAGWSLAEQKMN
jgi:hypothetical protein